VKLLDQTSPKTHASPVTNSIDTFLKMFFRS
jgi:hypothetical protein